MLKAILFPSDDVIPKTFWHIFLTLLTQDSEFRMFNKFLKINLPKSPFRTILISFLKFVSLSDSHFSWLQKNRTHSKEINLFTIFKRIYDQFDYFVSVDFTSQTQQTLTCSKLTIETIEQGVIYIQS